jgi:hypothetical protein
MAPQLAPLLQRLDGVQHEGTDMRNLRVPEDNRRPGEQVGVQVHEGQCALFVSQDGFLCSHSSASRSAPASRCCCMASGEAAFRRKTLVISADKSAAVSPVFSVRPSVYTKRGGHMALQVHGDLELPKGEMMSEFELSMSVPLDSDGFVRRECPTCEREFKWLWAEDTGSDAEPDAHYCPYCRVQSPADSWWTKAQLEHAQDVAMREVVGPELKSFQRSLAKMARESGGLIRVQGDKIVMDEPSPLDETDDMRLIDFPCHPSEPVKVADDWAKPVYCLVCGEPTAKY